jgi:hypothetical protein
MLDSEFMFMEYTSNVNRIGNITVVAMMAFDLEV